MQLIKQLARALVARLTQEKEVSAEAKYLSLAIWGSNLTSFHKRLRF